MSVIVTGAHSIVEAYLSLRVTPCAVCGGGSLDPAVPARKSPEEHVRFVTHCGNCGATEAVLFDVPGEPQPFDPLSTAERINPTTTPSALLDVGQWLTMHEMMRRSAEATPDPPESRWRKLRAAECLDEALKFYVAGNEVPPASAFFCESSRIAFRDNPQRFARGRLIELRAKLPQGSSAPLAGHKVRTWWKFW